MKTPVMVNGAGKMGREFAKAVIESDDFELLSYSFTGNNAPYIRNFRKNNQVDKSKR